MIDNQFEKLNDELNNREYKGFISNTVETVVDNTNNTVKANARISVSESEGCVTLSIGDNSYDMLKFI